MKKRVLVLCHDTIGSKMAGPGIRYQNIADQLKKVADVTLGVFSDTKKSSATKKLVLVSKEGPDFQKLFDKQDIIFAQWLSSDMLAYAKATGKIIIFDLYAPVPIEYMASQALSATPLDPQKDLEFTGILETYRRYLTEGDFFVCSNERQRDFWIGFMTATNILKPSTFKSISDSKNIILSPMGAASKPPAKQTLKLRKQLDLGADDFVLIWSGGIWDWFDAKTIVQAIATLKDPKVKLVFVGTQHPNANVPEMSESKQVRALASKLGLEGKQVFFLEGWIAYNELPAYWLDADAAIYADKESLETRFSHRTRVLDDIWTGLPTICSPGDYLSTVIAEKGLGIVAKDRSPRAFAEAIRQARDPKVQVRLHNNIKAEQKNFTWDALTKDLVAFVKNCDLHTPAAVQVPPSTFTTSKTHVHKKVLRRVKRSIKVLIGKE